MENYSTYTDQQLVDALTDNLVMREDVLRQGGFASVDVAWVVKFQIEDAALKEEIEFRDIQHLLEMEPWS